MAMKALWDTFRKVIFSVQRTSSRNIYRVLGIKISIRHNQSTMERHATVIRKNQVEILKRLRQKVLHQKLKVAFLVFDNQKWNCQSLYELLEGSEHFDPYVVLSITHKALSGFEKFTQSFEDNLKNFKGFGLRVIEGYNQAQNKCADLGEMGFDIIFYTSPSEADHCPEHWIEKTSTFALLCYVPYAVAEAPVSMMRNRWFFESIFRHYIVSDKLIDEYEPIVKQNKASLVVTGHPKLDVYMKGGVEVAQAKIIIYAPHFTVGKRFFSTGTFDWSGEFMLNYAQNHPELHFVFKPHPLLKSQFIKHGIMSQSQIENYFASWQDVGTVCESGNYFEFFKRSYALVTDSASFLLEYYPTKRPVIRLMSKTYTYNNALTEMVASDYYIVRDTEALKATLETVLEKGEDPLREKRLQYLDLFQPAIGSSAKRIADDLYQLIYGFRPVI